MFAHDLHGEISALVRQLKLARLRELQQAIPLHAGDGLRHRRARMLEALSDAGAQRHDALLLKIEDGAEVHLCGVDQIGQPVLP